MDLPTPWSAVRPSSSGSTSCSPGNTAPGRETSDAIFALSQLARYSGDRARDLPDSLREQVLARLEQLGADETILRPVREYHELEAAQESIALGDALPIGLRLREEDQQPAPVVDSASG